MHDQTIVPIQWFGFKRASGERLLSMSRKGDCWDNAPMESGKWTSGGRLRCKKPLPSAHADTNFLGIAPELRQRLHFGNEFASFQ